MSDRGGFLFAFIVVFVIFFDELFTCFLFSRNIILENGGLKQYEAMILASFGYSLLLFDIFKQRISRLEVRTILFMFFILILFWFTQLRFPNSSSSFRNYFLLFGSECIPAAYIGARLGRDFSSNKVDSILPFFIVIVSVLLGVLGWEYIRSGVLIKSDDRAINYQTMSYYMAFCYSYCAYLLLFSQRFQSARSWLIRLILFFDMLFCAIMCLLNGGRGAFVYIVVITFYLLIRLFRSSKLKKGTAVLVIAFVSFLFVYLSFHFNVWNSVGMSRVLGHLTDDDIRIQRYANGISVFLDSPVFGKGIGSVWMTIGFYSHNLFIDLLAETGLIGTLLFSGILILLFVRLFRLTKINSNVALILIVGIGALLESMFSGYWLAMYKIYFVCAFSYCARISNCSGTN